MDGRKINLITPPIEYSDNNENIGELEITSANVLKLETNPKKVKQWPDPEIEVDDND